MVTGMRIDNIRALYGLFFFIWDITAYADLTSNWSYILVVPFLGNTGNRETAVLGAGPAEATA